MSTVYDLTCAAELLILGLEQDGGVLSPEAEERLQAFADESEDKLEALAVVYHKLAEAAKADKSEADRFLHRRKSRLAARERVAAMGLALLKSRAELVEPTTVRTRAGTVYLGKSQATVQGPSEASEWPEEYRTAVYKPDKAGALRDLKAGETIPGLSLAEGVDGWRVRR